VDAGKGLILSLFAMLIIYFAIMLSYTSSVVENLENSLKLYNEQMEQFNEGQ
jgi:uncharacterized protein YoxC